MNQKSLERIVAIFDRYCFGHHFYLQDLRTNETFESGVTQRYPIGSCFKLAVLVALFEKIERDCIDICERLEVRQNCEFHGISILASLPEPLEMSWLGLAHLMITASDGWATDLIIEWVGLASVNEVLKRNTCDSHLALNLNDMVERFESVPMLPKAKRHDWKQEEAEALLDKIAQFGFTNGKDLALLAKSSFSTQFGGELNALFQQTIVAKRLLPRTTMFLSPEIRCLTKTGSLVRNFFTNDCGLFFDLATDEPIAFFGYCSHGWQLPASTCETIGGLIGLEIASAIQLNPTPNWDWSEQAASLFLGGI